MLHAEARHLHGANPQGEYVPLAEQDTSLWDTQMIDAAEALLVACEQMGDIRRFQLEGALQSAHVYRRLTGNANWFAVMQLYDALMAFARRRWSRSIAPCHWRGARRGRRFPVHGRDRGGLSAERLSALLGCLRSYWPR